MSENRFNRIFSVNSKSQKHLKRMIGSKVTAILMNKNVFLHHIFFCCFGPLQKFLDSETKYKNAMFIINVINGPNKTKNIRNLNLCT